MLREDWLGSYRSVAGVAAALERVSRRLSARRGKSFALQHSVGTLLENLADLDKDFAEFFPLLRAHVEEAAPAAASWANPARV
jgi:acyl carrier protein phosphodiesterase